MAIPDPATTNWVPIWNPLTQGPVGPQGPQGIPGNAVPHHLTHESGGIDEVLFPTGIKERGRSVAMGEWIDIPFDAANFVADAPMTWAIAGGNIVTNAYSLVGKTMFWSLFIVGSTIGGTATTRLGVVSPFAFSARYQLFKPARANINGVDLDMEIYKSGGNQLNIIMTSGATFPSVGGFRLDFTGFFEIA